MRITQIDGDLALYRNHRVVLWGGVAGEAWLLRLLDLLEAFGIAPDLCLGGKAEEDWQRLEALALEGNLVVQLGAELGELEVDRLEGILAGKGVKQISLTEAVEVLGLFQQMDRRGDRPLSLEESHQLQEQQILRHRLQASDYLLQAGQGCPLFLCMPPKTGDHSLIQTFLREKISHFFLFHSPEALDMELISLCPQPVKVILALRDPVAQHCSLLFQILGELSHSRTAALLAYGQERTALFREGGSVEDWFSGLVEAFLPGDPYGIRPIQAFLPCFSRLVLDLEGRSFDVDRGYGLWQEGNLQVFCYQLEKLDQVTSALAEFVGGDFNKLAWGNQGRDKWVGKTYETALEQLKFPSDYLDSCYSAPWVRQFYSAEDVEKFREKWEYRS